MPVIQKLVAGKNRDRRLGVLFKNHPVKGCLAYPVTKYIWLATGKKTGFKQANTAPIIHVTC